MDTAVNNTTIPSLTTTTTNTTRPSMTDASSAPLAPRLLLACPCLNVKMHLAAEPSEELQAIAGNEVQLGLAGVSVEQKILCCLAVADRQATVRCINCCNDVFTFKASSSSVDLEFTSLAFLANTIMFSPSNGLIAPCETVVGGEAIATILKDANYSHAFRLVLAPTPPISGDVKVSSTTPSTFSTTSTAVDSNISDTSSSAHRHETLYRPHLERVRTVLEQELEANLRAQQQRAEARIEAYKSQQLIALQISIETTRREKDRLWSRIMDRVNSPGAELMNNALGESGQPLSSDANGTHPFEGQSTLPIRLTSASRIEGAHGSFLDRRKSSVTEAAMSLQFREFDQRMASNSMRRQSVAPISPTNSAAETNANTAANAVTDRHDLSTFVAVQEEEGSSSTQQAQKTKKKVTIADSVTQVSIIEPEKRAQQDEDNVDEDEEELEVEDDEGVVFDLDEELGFDEQEANDDDVAEDDEGHASADEEESSSYPNGSASHGSAAMNIASGGRSLPKSGAPIVGSLRASYLRRQKGLEHHRRSAQGDEDDDDFGSDDNDDDLEGFNSQSAAQFGTSLPIMIQRRPTNPVAPPTTARAAALASSLAMPPGSSPAAAMLQRRLSRAYGNDAAEAGQNSNNAVTSGLSRSILAGSYLDVNPSAASGGTFHPIPGSVTGTLIIDPLMLLEEEHDRDDQEDRLRRRQQPFSSINHRRDQEKSRQQNPAQPDAASSFGTSLSQAVTADGMSLTAAMTRSTPTAAGSFLSENFEPPHLYSARTYVGDTPWEMPTRITVKSGGMQREGSHLDQQIAREMAKEMEKDRKEQEAASAASALSTSVQRTVGKILEEEEEVEVEEEAEIKQSVAVSGTHPFDQPDPTPDTNQGSIG